MALVLLAALVVADGGWHFAGEVHRQALAVDPGSYQRRPVLDLTVTGSGDGRAALAGPRGAPGDVGPARVRRDVGSGVDRRGRGAVR